MKLYDTPLAPNPRRVRIFLAEKHLSVPMTTIDLAKAEQATVHVQPVGVLIGFQQVGGGVVRGNHLAA